MPLYTRSIGRRVFFSALLCLIHAPEAFAASAEDAALAPVVVADFADGKPALTVGPGEKRFGHVYGVGPGKHPYSSYEGKRRSILKSVHQGSDGRPVLVADEPLSADIFGAMNLASGTFSGWFRSGKVMSEGGLLVSGWGYAVGSPRGTRHWALGIRDHQKQEKAGRLYFSASDVKLDAISRRPLDLSGDWIHLAVVWDADGGSRLYVNGEVASASPKSQASADEGQRGGLPPVRFPLQRLQIHADAMGGMRDLKFFDQPLNAKGIAALYRKQEPGRAMVEPVPLNRGARLARLGWDRAEQEAFIPVESGKPLLIKEATVLEAKEELRPAGWMAVDGFAGSGFPWWYHGYRDTGKARELHLTLDPSVRPNYLVGSGVFTGRLVGKGEKGADLALGGSGAWFGQMVPEGEFGSPMIIRQEKGVLEEIHFYQVLPTASPMPDEAYSLGLAEGEAFSPGEQRHFKAAYGEADRQWLLTTATAPEATAGFRTLPALRPLHLVSAPMNGDFALGSIALHLQTKRKAEPVRAQVVVHDLLWPGRVYARFELLLEPSAQGATSLHDLRLDLRDTFLPKGSKVWLSVTFEDEMELAIGKGGSQLALQPAEDAAKAKGLWREWEWRTVRDYFESISEPRPWASMDADAESGWWLRVYAPAYEAVDTGLRRLLTYFPGDPLFEATFQFTHPQTPDPSRAIALPESDGAPRWAVLSRECLLLYKEFINWWIDHRQHPDGEFGHWYGDDSDLLQDWPDLALITDPDGKVRRSLGMFADGVAGSYRLKDGEPVIRNGLNVRWTDELHAYEEGLNVQPHDFLLHYGDPVRFQRLLDTVSRYDGFLLKPEKNGMRAFAGEKETGHLFWSSGKTPEGNFRNKWNPLILHAGLMSAWYHDHPETWRLLESVGRWMLTRQQEADTSWKGGAFPLMTALQRHTGSLQWLEPYFDRELWESQRAMVLTGYPNVFDRLKELNREATFRATFEEPAIRYQRLGTEALGANDPRYLQGWVDWKLTGDRAHLYPALEALYRRLKFTMPVNTQAGQSGDRVAIPKPLISQLYLGGVPASRNRSFYPDFAVSYEGLDDTFAAMVLENTPSHLKILLYSFEEKPKKGKIITWALERGLYEVTRQPEEGAENEEPVRSELRLERGEGFEITLPPKTSWVVNVRQLKRDVPHGPLGDAAFVPGESHYAEGTLTVPLYNLGVTPLKGVLVRLLSEKGDVVAEETLKELPPVANWKLGRAELRFALKAKPGQRLILEADPESKHPEITRRNNRVKVELPTEVR